MPRALEFISTVNEDGNLPKTRREQVRGHLKLFAGSEVQIRIGKPKRSTKANAFYHVAIISPIRQAMIEAGIGYVEMADGSIKPVSHEAVHAYFRDKYLAPTVEVVFGEEKVMRPSTTRLDSTEFHYYLESIKHDEQVIPLGVHFEEPPDSLRAYSIEDLPY